MSDNATLLPPNSSKLEKAFAKCCIRITAIDVPYIALKNTELSPVQFLPWLAWEHRVDFWNPAWSESKKRAVITESKTFNQQRGTRSSLQYALDQIQSGWQIKAWHQQIPHDVPFTFILSNPDFPEITVDDLQSINTVVDATKSSRDHYLVAAKVLDLGKVFFGGTAHTDETISIATA